MKMVMQVMLLHYFLMCSSVHGACVEEGCQETSETHGHAMLQTKTVHDSFVTDESDEETDDGAEAAPKPKGGKKGKQGKTGGGAPSQVSFDVCEVEVKDMNPNVANHICEYCVVNFNDGSKACNKRGDKWELDACQPDEGSVWCGKDREKWQEIHRLSMLETGTVDDSFLTTESEEEMDGTDEDYVDIGDEVAPEESDTQPKGGKKGKRGKTGGKAPSPPKQVSYDVCEVEVKDMNPNVPKHKCEYCVVNFNDGSKACNKRGDKWELDACQPDEGSVWCGEDREKWEGIHRLSLLEAESDEETGPCTTCMGCLWNGQCRAEAYAKPKPTPKSCARNKGQWYPPCKGPTPPAPKKKAPPPKKAPPKKAPTGPIQVSFDICGEEVKDMNPNVDPHICEYCVVTFNDGSRVCHNRGDSNALPACQPSGQSVWCGEADRAAWKEMHNVA